MYHASMKAKMGTLEVEKAELEAKLRDIQKPDPVALHPALAEVYARKVANLSDALNDASTQAEAADLLRGLIDRIILLPEAGAPCGHAIELFGELDAILSLCGNERGANAKAHARGEGYKQVTMVSGARDRRNLPLLRCLLRT